MLTTTQTETNFSLWKYFTDDAAKIKDWMWTIIMYLKLKYYHAK